MVILIPLPLSVSASETVATLPDRVRSLRAEEPPAAKSCSSAASAFAEGRKKSLLTIPVPVDTFQTCLDISLSQKLAYHLRNRVQSEDKTHDAPMSRLRCRHERRIAVMPERCCSTPFFSIRVERTVSAPWCATEIQTLDISSLRTPKQSAKALSNVTSSIVCGAGLGLFLGEGMVAGKRYTQGGGSR